MGDTEHNERGNADSWVFQVLCAHISMGYPCCVCHVPGFSAKGMCVSGCAEVNVVVSVCGGGF